MYCKCRNLVTEGGLVHYSWYSLHLLLRSDCDRHLNQALLQWKVLEVIVSSLWSWLGEKTINIKHCLLRAGLWRVQPSSAATYRPSNKLASVCHCPVGSLQYATLFTTSRRYLICLALVNCICLSRSEVTGSRSLPKTKRRTNPRPLPKRRGHTRSAGSNWCQILRKTVKRWFTAPSVSSANYILLALQQHTVICILCTPAMLRCNPPV